MLKHTDTDDSVVLLVMINVTVIANFHTAVIVQARGPQLFSRQLRLRHAQVIPDALDAIVGRRRG